MNFYLDTEHQLEGPKKEGIIVIDSKPPEYRNRIRKWDWLFMGIWIVISFMSGLSAWYLYGRESDSFIPAGLSCLLGLLAASLPLWLESDRRGGRTDK